MIDLILVGGYGRMGTAIREVAQKKEYQANVVGIVVAEKKERIEGIDIYETVDEALSDSSASSCIIIDFSNPQNTLRTLSSAVKYRVPVIIGTTGFTKEEYLDIEKYAKRIPILLSSNMSRGITVLLHLLPQIIKYLGEEYDIEILEEHHRYKKDAPSGTAISLAHAIAGAKGWDLEDVARYEREGMIGERPLQEIGIQSIRGGGNAGKHSIFLLGEDEHIEISHQAFSRKAFARGAIQAAIWLHGRSSGMYSIFDVE